MPCNVCLPWLEGSAAAAEPIPSRRSEASGKAARRSAGVTVAPYLGPIESLPRAYRVPIECLSRAYREPVESLSRAYREPIESLSKAYRVPTYREPIESLSKFYGEPVESLVQGTRQGSASAL